MPDLRAAIVQWANWAVANRSLFFYLEARPFALFEPTPQRHLVADCSAFVTWCFYLAGAPDPMGNGFSGIGNTETLSGRGQKLTLAQVEPGDVVVYAVGQPLGNQHTALIVEGGTDPLTVSHGQPGDPSYVRVSQDGRPPSYYRFLPVSPPSPKEPADMAMSCTDPTSGGVWFTDVNGALYAEFGAPYITGANLNTHPQWHAGQAEGGPPCLGIFTWKDPSGNWGIGYYTAAASGGTPYSTYKFDRAGAPH